MDPVMVRTGTATIERLLPSFITCLMYECSGRRIPSRPIALRYRGTSNRDPKTWNGHGITERLNRSGIVMT